MEKEEVTRVRELLAQEGLVGRIEEVATTTRTAQDAAQTIGCEVDQIAKSVVFRSTKSDRAILVVACGGKRVDENLLARQLGEPVTKADAEFVRERTGFAIGGVSPVAHREAVEVFLDESLFRYHELWAAAGSPFTIFRVSPQELRVLTHGKLLAA